MMITRRDVVVGAPMLVASTIVLGSNAHAFSIKGGIRKIAAAVVQGVNFATNPAAQIATVTRTLEPLVREVSPNAARKLQMVTRIAEQSSTLEARLRTILSVAAPQAVPLFVNTGVQSDQVRTYTVQAAQPLDLTSSVEDELRGDPAGYVEKNADYLGDYVKTYSTAHIAKTFNLPAGAIQAHGISAQQANTAGFFPSVLSIEDILQLVSIFRR